MKWDSELEALVGRLSNKHRVPRQNVKNMVEHTMKCIRDSLKDPSMPKIVIHDFGVFKGKPDRLRSKLKHVRRLAKKGTISNEKLQDLEQTILSLIDRATKENPYAGGQ